MIEYKLNSGETVKVWQQHEIISFKDYYFLDFEIDGYNYKISNAQDLEKKFEYLATNYDAKIYTDWLIICFYGTLKRHGEKELDAIITESDYHNKANNFYVYRNKISNGIFAITLSHDGYVKCGPESESLRACYRSYLILRKDIFDSNKQIAKKLIRCNDCDVADKFGELFSEKTVPCEGIITTC